MMVEELRKEGNEAYNRGDLEAAMGAYSRALELSPTNASLLCNRSLVAAKLGRFNESLNDAELAINASQPGDYILVKAHFRKAAALGAQSKIAEAIDALRAGMRFAPGDASLGREIVRLTRLLTHSQLAKIWAGIIDYGEKPSAFSSRDGRLLKPVQGRRRLDDNAISKCLSTVFESSTYFRTQAENLIGQAWCKGRDYSTKDGIGVMRSLAYLKAGDSKQAMADAKFAVAYAKGDDCTTALAVKAMVHADLNELTLAALEMTGALEISKSHVSEFEIFLDNVSSKMPRQHREALENGGSSGLKAWLEEEEEHNKPEYLRKRPKYYYYYEWTRKRIEERCPGLPEPVMDKLLTMDSNELDLLLQHEQAIKGQALEYLEVYERDGPEVLETYKTPPLSWDEVKALEGPGTVGLGTGGGTAPGSGFLEYKRDTDHALIGGAGEAGFMTEAEKAGEPIAPRLPPDQMRDQLNIITATEEAQQKLLDSASRNSQDSGTDAMPHAQTSSNRKMQILQNAEEKLFKSIPRNKTSIEYHQSDT